MAKLVYSALGSLDGYIANEHGKFEGAVPDDEVHAFINDLDREAGTYLYGRRMYEVMVGWETPDTLPDHSSLMLDAGSASASPSTSPLMSPSNMRPV
jgi:hypothetical protein